MPCELQGLRITLCFTPLLIPLISVDARGEGKRKRKKETEEFVVHGSCIVLSGRVLSELGLEDVQRSRPRTRKQHERKGRHVVQEMPGSGFGFRVEG